MAVGDSSLLAEHAVSIRRLLSGDYGPSDLERLHGHDVYSYRLNEKRRLLFAIESVEGNRRLVILQHLEDHKYNRSTFLRTPGIVSNYLKKKSITYRETASFEPCVPRSFVSAEEMTSPLQLVEVAYFQRRFLTVSESQNQARRISFPGLVCGVAGSGKSFLTQLFLTDGLRTHAAHGPLLYVCHSQALVHAMRRSWDELPLAQKEGLSVLFLSYEELMHAQDTTTVGARVVDKADFVTWYGERVKVKGKIPAAFKAKLDVSQVYEECRIASGYTEEEYHRLGVKQCSLDAGERIELYKIHAAYLSSLKNNGLCHPGFYRFAPTRRFALVVVDEAQDLTPGQLRQLGELTLYSEATPNVKPIVFCLDEHQQLYDGYSIVPFIVSHFAIDKANQVTLRQSHRCPMRVVAAGNEVLAMKLRLVGGVASKDGVAQIHHSLAENGLGHVFALPPDGLKSNAWLWEQVGQPHCAIVTSAAHLEEAQKYFNKGPDAVVLLFTPETIKGLEYPIVIAWKVYDNSFMKDASRQGAVLSASAFSVHRPKEGMAQIHFGPQSNGIYVAYTRALQILIISELETRENPFLLGPLKALAEPIAGLSALCLQSTSNNWEEEAARQLEERQAANDQIALIIFKSKLGKTEAEFHEARARLYRPAHTQAVASSSRADSLKYGLESKRPCIEVISSSENDSKRAPRDDPKKERKDNKSKKQQDASVSSPAKIIQYASSSPEARGCALRVMQKFEPKLLKVVLGCCDGRIWLQRYQWEGEKPRPIVS